MLQPTRELFEMARGKDVRLTFFIDVGYLIQAEKYPDLREELKKVKAQIQEMLKQEEDKKQQELQETLAREEKKSRK